jgi:hypothetical protein
MAKRMEEEEFLKHFTAMDGAAKFFLFDSFKHVEDEMRDRIADELFGREIHKIPATEDDHKIAAQAGEKLKEGTVADILGIDDEVLSESTLTKFSEIWVKAQEDSRTILLQFPLSKKLQGRELLGHIVNLAFFVEVLANRHLFLLNVRGQIDDLLYKVLDETSVANRLTYAVTPEMSGGVSQIKHLFRLRNYAVHYNLNNVSKFETNLQQLVNIWREVQQVCEVLHKKQNIVERNFGDIIAEFISAFEQRYVAS